MHAYERPWSAEASRRHYRRLVRQGPGVWFASAVLLLAPVYMAVITVGGDPGIAILAVVLLLSTLTDLFWRRIFHAPLLAGLAILTAARLANPSLHSLGDSLAGLGVCFGVMLFLYLCFRGGEGDVKLIAFAGFCLGPDAGLETLMAGYLLAAGAALVCVAWRGCNRLQRVPCTNRHPLMHGTLPMAPFFLLAFLWLL
jgi:Flp pilus assembly protein protease CpaA